MKKNNWRIFALLSLFIIQNCADKGPEDPLILPPNFAEMPDVNKANSDILSRPADPDTEKLRELLLKGQ